MKRFLQLIVLLMFVGISAANTQEQTQREAERKVLDAKLERSIGNEFPMAYFIDSHGKRVDRSQDSACDRYERWRDLSEVQR